jgi:beta-phosphoglucomutase family hydrolase
MMNFAVIFDMDGVIVDSNEFHKKGWNTFLKKHNLKLDENEWANKLFGRTGAETLPHLFKRILTEDEVADYCDEINANFRDVAKDDITPLPGLKAFLDKLTEAGIKFAMATSAPPKNVRFVLEKTGLQSYFKYIVDDTQIKRSKPDPEVFIKASEKLETPPERCVVFEDSLSGIQAANSAGTKIIGVTTTHPPEKLVNTVFTIPDFLSVKISDLQNIFAN